MLRKMLIGFAILFLLLVGAGVYLYLKVQLILHEAEARQKMLQPRPKKGGREFSVADHVTRHRIINPGPTLGTPPKNDARSPC
jgi:hypothetical protein